MAETLKPEINIPLTVGPLSYDTPRAYPPREHNGTQFGASWGYGTPAGTFYADEKCQAAIVASGVRIGKGAVFTILKKKASDGKSNIWEISGAGAAPVSSGSAPAARTDRITFADISFAYRECLFAASAHLNELASLKEGTTVDFSVIQAAAATMMIQCDRAACLPRAPKAPPNLDGEHTKVFLAWLAEYRARPDVTTLWPGGKGEWSAFIQKAANKESMKDVAELNDPAVYEQIKTAIMAETANRQAQAQEQPMESGEADIPF